MDHFTPHAMDYSFLDDPDAIAEILASAEAEHRAMQSARRWDDKTLALHIATSRHCESVIRDEIAHAQEEEEWKERVLRMSDEDLETAYAVIRAKIDPDIEAHQAMSDEDKEKKGYMIRFIKKMKSAKARLAFIQQERESRGAKKRYSERLQRMSDAILDEEMIAITAQFNKNTEEKIELPIVHEPRVRDEIQGRAWLLEMKYTCLIQEHKRRAPKLSA